jgi:esterase
MSKNSPSPSQHSSKFFTQITGLEPHRGEPGPPSLVFLHGVMGYALNFRRIAREFEATHRVLAYDQRGHGRSFHADLAAEPDAYSPERMADDLRLILDDLGWSRIRLVGHSMGGRVALTFAALYPERVESLVIVDIGPEMIEVAGGSMVQRILDKVPVPFATKAAAKTWFDQDFHREFSGASPMLAPWLYSNITELADGQATWRFDAAGLKAALKAGRDRDRWDLVDQLRCSTLWLRGELSADLPREQFERIAARRPGLIHAVEIPGVGHWLHAEAPEALLAELSSFWSR